MALFGRPHRRCGVIGLDLTNAEEDGIIGMVSNKQPAETELDRRIRHIVERVERDHRTRPIRVPTPWVLSWKGHLFVCFAAAAAGFSGYFMSEFLHTGRKYSPVHGVEGLAEHLVGPPGWLISSTVAFGMAYVFYFFAKLLTEEFAWARKWRDEA